MKIKNIYGAKWKEPGISVHEMLLIATVVNGFALALILVDLRTGPGQFRFLNPYYLFPSLMSLLYATNRGERSMLRIVSTAALCMVLPFVLAATRAGIGIALFAAGSLLMLTAVMALLRRVGSTTPPPWGSGPARLK